MLFEENKQLKLNNGVLFYNNTPFNGTLKSFNHVNKTKNTVSYLNGKKEGAERKIFLNDSLAEIRFYKKGLKVGVHKGWTRKGQQMFEYPYSKNGVYHGAIKEWYDNGQLVRVFNYVNGKEAGSQKMWLSNGNIRANYTVVNGERFGLIGLKKCYSVKTNDEK
jgi:antitoxin component YwqK of YwqJK toxin-antitoxin module